MTAGRGRTIAQALADARTAGLDRLDAQWLLARLLGHDRAWLLAHDDEALSEEANAHFTTWCARRAAGEPFAYLVGEQEFHGLRLAVNPDVLVPRPDTETLVDWALDLLAGELARHSSPSVIDLGTGSGAIALAVLHRFPTAQVTALDASAAALAVAVGNAERLRLPVNFRHGDWWQPVAGLHFDLALSNPPYIAAADRHLADLTHEPLSALTPGGDGLDAIRQIVADAPAHLTPGAWLLLEHGWDQAAAVRALLTQRGFEAVQSRRDLGGLERCSGGRWGSSSGN
jgi:release factor glutamine methyltransferase